VLDASAVVAYLDHEEGWEVVRGHLDGSLLSTVNLGEVLRGRGDPQPLVWGLADLGVEIEPLSIETAYRQTLVPNVVPYTKDGKTKKRRLGWGDRVAVALAHERGLGLLTSDHTLVLLGEPYSFEVFR
jgi:PIN domain nuclease of toxin-antitoxin system